MSIFDNLDTIDPHNCGLSPEAAKRFAVQIEIMKILKKNYPNCMSGPDPKELGDALRDLSLITGTLLAGVHIQKNEATFKYVVISYLRGLADDMQAISKQASQVFRGITKDAQSG